MKKSIARPYKAGSIIYFTGDKSDDIYLLQQGFVRLTHASLEGKAEEIVENINKGEFFGVKSALGYFPREETAQAMSDCVILVLSIASFEDLCTKNVTLMLRMLKVFSSQLRKIHKIVKQQLGEQLEFEQDLEFLKVGEYYYKQSKDTIAKYVFNKFLIDFSESKFTKRVQALQNNIEQGLPYPTDLESLEDFTEDDSDSPQADIDLATPDFDNPDQPLSDESHISEQYYAGLNYFSQNDFDNAISTFQNVIQTKSFQNASDTSFIEKSHFELIRCFLKKNTLDKSIETGMEFLKKYPNSEYIKQVLILIGNIFELKKNIPQAVLFYQKVIPIQPKDKHTAFAVQKIEQLKGK